LVTHQLNLVADNKLEAEGVKYITEALMKNKTLTALNLGKFPNKK